MATRGRPRTFDRDQAIDRADRSTLIGYAMEKAAVVLVFASVSVLAVSSALEAAEKPIEEVRIALAPEAG